ncbi:MAG TPA: hypothetical protein VGX37_12435, partial [Allosphingosinicella sp.]|nr:hypothetical protein [Allosphingosinicella sp.]
MTPSKAALAAISATCALAFAGAAAAQAQQPVGQATARMLSLSREERAALLALQTAAAGMDRAAQDAALAAARAAVRGADGRYALGHFQVQI